MGQSDRSKVCYDCAGVPVIKRIVRNMREGGVGRFVIVVGHMAESVMSALDGEKGVLWAFQKEQKGTGHAAECGLKALEDIGFSGSVIISMGDKIVSPKIVKGLLARTAGREMKTEAVLGVQRVTGPTSRGHVIFRNERPVCIVEHKDAVRDNNAEALASPFVNAAFYAFDAAALSKSLKTLRSDNAQGEFYLTDTIAQFAEAGTLDHYVVEDPDDMLTYSTRLELRKIAHRFLRKSSEFLKDAASQEADCGVAPKDEVHLRSEILTNFIKKYGDRPCLIASAPGRINLMGRHIEHRGGSTNMMATNQRMTFIVAPREDDIVHIANIDPAFPESEFRIGEYFRCTPRPTSYASPASTAEWLDYLELPETKAELEANRGHWLNYVKGAVLRFQMAESFPLCGMDILVSGNIPVAAGLSSSSALVVATAEAVVALNELNLSTRAFVDLCGEGEWFVGSRGGAGDQAAMKCSREGMVTHLKFKPFEIGEAVKFPKEYSIIVINSGEMAKKSEGARETFNARIRDYETAFNDIKRHYPDLPITYFRDIAFLPDKDREKALACLSGTVKGVATFGVKECRRSEDCLTLLKRGDFVGLGAMMKDSHDGDRLGQGEYECSTKRIDALCDRLNATPGVLGSQLVGAGLGGCVIALVKADSAQAVIDDLAKNGYNSFVCNPARGSGVEF